MLKTPEYAEDIIVLVKIDESFFWFLGEKTDWVLDYPKWDALFASLPGDDVPMDPTRDGLAVLTKDNFKEFQKRMLDASATKEELSELILGNLPIDSWAEKGHLFPSLFVDFDHSILLSMYPEPLLFEDYVPDGWIGEFKNFYDLIPISEKYWIIDGVDYMPQE